jgi:hypothetical protein
MDPYLEVSMWMNVYTQLSAEIARQLAPKLRPRYLALAAERFAGQRPEITVAIRDRANRQLVIAIEVLSPTSKGGDGREQYLAKRRRLLLGRAHLLEIDLLRQGERVPMQQALPAAPYFVLLSRAENRPILEVWPVSLQDPLPTVPVPLLPGDPDVTLNLQLALTTIYDLLGFDLAVDYTQAPEIPLTDEEAEWVEWHLWAAGLRP